MFVWFSSSKQNYETGKDRGHVMQEPNSVTFALPRPAVRNYLEHRSVFVTPAVVMLRNYIENILDMFCVTRHLPRQHYLLSH